MDTMQARVDALAQRLDPGPAPAVQPPWGQAEAEIGFPVPTEYRKWVERFGGGWISGELFIPAPTKGPREPELPPGFSGITAYASVVRQTCGVGDNLLPWATSSTGRTAGEENSAHVFWDMQGPDPDRWSILVSTWQGHQYRYKGGMLAFLLDLVQGKHVPFLCPTAAKGDAFFIPTHNWAGSSQGVGV